MEMSRKGFAVGLIILVIAGIGVLGGFAYRHFSQNPIEKRDPGIAKTVPGSSSASDTINANRLRDCVAGDATKEDICTLIDSLSQKLSKSSYFAFMRDGAVAGQQYGAKNSVSVDVSIFRNLADLEAFTKKPSARELVISRGNGSIIEFASNTEAESRYRLVKSQAGQSEITKDGLHALRWVQSGSSRETLTFIQGKFIFSFESIDKSEEEIYWDVIKVLSALDLNGS